MKAPVVTGEGYHAAATAQVDAGPSPSSPDLGDETPCALPSPTPTLADLLGDPQLLELRGSPEEAAAARTLSRALRPVRADELAAAIRAHHPGCDPWKATRILGAVLEALQARHRPTMRQIVDDLAAAGEHVSLGLVEDTVARARRVGLRTEGCGPYRAGGRPRRQRCEYATVEWTPATVAVTADREVRAAVLLGARLLRDLGALALRSVARAVRRGVRALVDLWRRLRGDNAPNDVNKVNPADLEAPSNTGSPPDPGAGTPSVNVERLDGLWPSSPDRGPGGTGHTHQDRSRPRRPSRHSRLLGELLGEHAARVHEGDVIWTAADLLRIATSEGWVDPLRAARDAYTLAVSTALSDGAEREQSAHPIRSPARWAAMVARRILRREEPPPWPERRPPAGIPPASPSPRPPLRSPRRDPESAQEARNGSPAVVETSAAAEAQEARTGLAAMSAAEEEAAWAALSAEERTRAEATVRQTSPALAKVTHEQGHIWRLAVLAAAGITPPR